MRWVVLLVVLVVAQIAGAACDSKYPDNCRVLFNGGVNLATNLSICGEFSTPTATPKAGQQFFYCRAGIGLCTKDAGGVERCSGGAGGATVVIGATPPASPSPGWLWWDTVSGNLFIYYFDGTSSQWVPATATAAAASDIIRSSLAPFMCTAATAGIYDDVDCKQICVCGGASPYNWCRSDNGLCGSNIDCCTAATTTTTSAVTTTSTTTTTTSTTTTTTLATATNWVPNAIAAWMLDEASGARVNLTGNSALNLAEAGGTLANNTTNKMEGVAAVEYAPNITLSNFNATLNRMPAPATCGFWARSTGSGNQDAWITAQNGSGGIKAWYGGDFVWRWQVLPSGSAMAAPSVAVNNWAHVVLASSASAQTFYQNGVSVATGTTTWTTPDATGTPFTLGQGGSYFRQGEIDEAWCFAQALAATSVCRICSCGIRGEQCTCNGAAYVSTGRNAASCNTCALPACNAATPP